MRAGFEATRRIRELERTTGRTPCPIAALTANVVPGSREECLAAGMTDFMPKPFNSRDLQMIVDTHIRGIRCDAPVTAAAAASSSSASSSSAAAMDLSADPDA